MKESKFCVKIEHVIFILFFLKFGFMSSPSIIFCVYQGFQGSEKIGLKMQLPLVSEQKKTR